ncbi:MAG: hypothetical protein ACE14S_09090 [Candidatus Bathyarchaeia archaeon]
MLSPISGSEFFQEFIGILAPVLVVTAMIGWCRRWFYLRAFNKPNSAAVCAKEERREVSDCGLHGFR